MANNENLQPFTKENAKYYGKKGGIKSGIVRAERKSIKEQMKLLLEMPVVNKSRINKLKEVGFEESEINNQLYLTYTIFEKALPIITPTAKSRTFPLAIKSLNSVISPLPFSLIPLRN